MKKILFFASLLIGGNIVAQVEFTPTNYHQYGTKSYFLCDSIVPTYNEITGNGVTWSYDTVAKVSEQTFDILEKDTNDALFPTVNNFIDNGNFTHLFLEKTTDKEILHGLNINLSDLGFVNAYFTTPPKAIQYPFSLGNQIADTIAGSADVLDLGLLDRSLWGKHFVNYDGFGTLKVGNTTINSVSRIHSFDTLTVDTEDPNVGNIMVVLDIFEYYRTDITTFPVFQISQIQIFLGAEAAVSNKVYSLFDPSISTTIDFPYTTDLADLSSADFHPSPNPMNESLNLYGNFGQAEITLVNQLGKIVYQGIHTAGTSIPTIELESGMYFVQAVIDGKHITRKVVKQ